MIQNVAIFDIVSLALILILGIKGIINGFIKEIAGLIGIVGGVYLASRFAQEAGSLVDKHIYQIQNSASLYLIGFLSVLILFWIASLIIGKIIESLLHMSGLGFIDKLAGFFIGSMKIFLIFSILAITLSNIDFIKEKMDSVFAKSFMYPVFIDVGKFIIKQDPNQIVKQVKEKTTTSLEDTK
jgi:membrane protein required for colicin V production